MRVDFYQLGPGTGVEHVAAALAGKLLADGERLLIVGEDEAVLARLDRQLWDHSPASFLPHALAGSGEDPKQPVLLSTGAEASNGARNFMIVDGLWREAALHFDRTFYLFDATTLDVARATWKKLKDRDALERHFWANENGRWVEKA